MPQSNTSILGSANTVLNLIKAIQLKQARARMDSGTATKSDSLLFSSELKNLQSLQPDTLKQRQEQLNLQKTQKELNAPISPTEQFKRTTDSLLNELYKGNKILPEQKSLLYETGKLTEPKIPPKTNVPESLMANILLKVDKGIPLNQQDSTILKIMNKIPETKPEVPPTVIQRMNYLLQRKDMNIYSDNPDEMLNINIDNELKAIEKKYGIINPGTMNMRMPKTNSAVPESTKYWFDLK